MIRRIIYTHRAYRSVAPLYLRFSTSGTDSHDVFNKLQSRVSKGEKWESIDSDTQNSYLKWAKSLPKTSSVSKLNNSYVKARESFHYHLKLALDSITEGFAIKKDFTGFDSNLSLDFAVFHENDLLGFIVLEEPEHYSADSSLSLYYKTRALLYELKYDESTTMCRIPIQNILDSPSSSKMVLQVIQHLVDVQVET